MATTLDESFQDDLDDLDDEEEEQQEINNSTEEPNDPPPQQHASLSETNDDKTSKLQPVLSNFRNQERYKSHMRAMQQVLENNNNSDQVEDIYTLVVASNKLVVAITDEISNIHQHVADLFSKRFKDLYSMVMDPILYLRTVKAIGNESDLTNVNLDEILPSSTVMVVTVTGSTAMGDPLNERELNTVLSGCDEALALDASRKETLNFVAKYMNVIAPNMTALLGASLAAELLSATGGLAALCKVPSGNVMVIGKAQVNSGGLAKRPSDLHNGLIYNCKLVQDAPVQYRKKVMRVLSGRVSLAAHIDFAARNQRQVSGEVNPAAQGMLWRDEITRKIAKWMDPGPGKTKKALPVPDARKAQRRGGERARRLKERLGLTDMRKDMNRTSFADMTDEYGDSAMGLGLGMLGKDGSGRLRITKKEQRLAKRKLNAAASSGTATTIGIASVAGSASSVSGTASSLAFTPFQGMELVNPELAAKKVREANNKYFGAGFTAKK